MMKGRITMRTTLFAVLVACTGCVQTAQQASQSIGDRPAKSKVVASTLSSATPPAHGWDATTVEERGFRKIQMLSDTHGWTVSRSGDLYRTTDGGDTWQPADSFKLPDDTVVTDFYFSDSWGGVAVAKNNLHFDEDTAEGTYEDATWIMQTNDGGRQWARVYEGEEVQISRLVIVNENEAWAVGRRFISAPTRQDRGFILHSSDGGKTWADVSQRLPANTRRIDTIYTTDLPNVILLTSDEHIFSTRDGGNSWNRAGTLPVMGDEIAITRIGMTEDNLLWVSGGRGGTEGTRSVVAMRKGESAWTSYWLTGVYLSDLVFLSGKELVAAGCVEADEDVLSSEMRGVVLSSTDGAQSWNTIYRSEESPCINSLSAGNRTHLFAAGENGLILRRDRALMKTLNLARQ